MPVQVQSHIHLAPTLGAAPENAPIYKWGITAYSTDPHGFWSLDYSTNGKLHVFVLEEDGDPVVNEDYRASLYIVAEHGFTVQERIAQVKNMQGRFVYLVENNHPDDGEDHTDYVRLMFCDEVKGEEPIDPFITHLEMKVSLVDARNLAT